MNNYRNNKYVKQLFINTHLYHDCHFSRINNEVSSCFIISYISLFEHYFNVLYVSNWSIVIYFHMHILCNEPILSISGTVRGLVISWWLYHDQLYAKHKALGIFMCYVRICLDTFQLWTVHADCLFIKWNILWIFFSCTQESRRHEGFSYAA